MATLNDSDIQAFKNEAATRAATVLDVTIPANGFSAQSVYGSSFFIMSTNGTVNIRGDMFSERPYNQSQGEEFPEFFRFKRLEIRNPNNFEVTVKIWAGFGKWVDMRPQVSESPTTAVPVYDSSLAAGGVVALPGTPPGGTSTAFRRRSVIISNDDPGNALRLQTAGGANLATIPPLQVLEFQISGPLQVKNTTGSAIPCIVSETWYYSV